ncbi:MAG: rhomboid family intramembrane serine protease [Proteobacteria bacterium]|nr:rhomboid family intramembrane serine protease [Pseudomonadota bacterium]
MIIIQPLNKKIGQGFFPFGSLFLIVTLVLVFVTVQLNDNKYRNEAIQYYFQNGLDKIEFPLYIKFMRKYMRDDYYYNQLENLENGKLTGIDIYWMQRTDPFFQKCLENDQCLSPSTLTYLNWQDKRREYLHILDKISFNKYGFKPAAPSVDSLFTNLFVSADLYQFVINILFLIAIAGLIEEKIGLIGLFFSYFVCGLSMTSVYCLLMPFSLVPVSGVNGAIAGLVGMMVVFSRFKEITFIYFNFKEVKTKTLNSLTVLFFWLATQGLLVYLTAFDMNQFVSENVACLVGILLAFIVQKVQRNKQNQLTEIITKPTDLQTRLADAVKEISLMNYNEAKKILYSLLDEYPTNKEIYFQLFNIVKSNPASEEYHDIAQKIFLIKEASRSTVTMINLVFKNYVRRAQPTIRFDVDTFISLLQRFRKAGFYEDAEKILKVLIKHNTGDMLSEVLAREQLLLARCYLLKKDKLHGDRLLEWLVETFPNTESAKQARSFVNVKNSGTYY